MKKILLLLALCAGANQLMAQTKLVAPPDNIINDKLFAPLKTDSSLFKLPAPVSTENLLKQPFDVNELLTNQNVIAATAEPYKMPVAKLNGYSKMPVVMLEGYSKMPVAGKISVPVATKVNP